MTDPPLLPTERIERTILVLRGHKIILDADLALLYAVETKRVNEQVRRNRGRFPGNFMFQLEAHELRDLRSHFATSSFAWGGRRSLPFAFTEHGALMAASVLSSPRAVEMSILVVRAFVRLRNLLATNADLPAKLVELERTLASHDEHILLLFAAIRDLMTPPEKPLKRIVLV